MINELHELADAVHDEATFVHFARLLAHDWEDEQAKEANHPSSPYGQGANGWENGTVGAFLEAAARWAEDSRDGLPHYTPPTNAWRRCAHILLAGKFYE